MNIGFLCQRVKVLLLSRSVLIWTLLPFAPKVRPEGGNILLMQCCNMQCLVKFIEILELMMFSLTIIFVGEIKSRSIC